MTHSARIQELRKTNFVVQQAFAQGFTYANSLEIATLTLAEMLETTQNALIKCFERQNIGPIYQGNVIFPAKFEENTLNNPEEEK